jgi:hypothetical protein
MSANHAATKRRDRGDHAGVQAPPRCFEARTAMNLDDDVCRGRAGGEARACSVPSESEHALDSLF